MSRFRLHAASWFDLVAVCLLLLSLNGAFGPIGFFVHGHQMGFPESFWESDSDELDVTFLALDLAFSVFVLVGTVAAIELWCRRHGPLKVSLLSLFGLMAGIGFFCYLAFHGVEGISTDDVTRLLRTHIFSISFYLIPVVFGVAVVGWVKLIGLAFKRRS